MIKETVIGALIALVVSHQSYAGIVADSLADIETGRRCDKVGDGGKAVGPHQFHKEAWSDTTKMRSKAGLAVWGYSSATNYAASSCYAETYAASLSNRIHKATGKPVSSAQVYAAWDSQLSRR